MIQFDTIVNKCLVGRTNPTQIHKIQIDFPVDTDQDLLRVLNRLVECFLEPRRHDNNGALSPILAFAIPRLAAKMKLSFFNSLAAVAGAGLLILQGSFAIAAKQSTFDDIINDVIEGRLKLTSRNLRGVTSTDFSYHHQQAEIQCAVLDENLGFGVSVSGSRRRLEESSSDDQNDSTSNSKDLDDVDDSSPDDEETAPSSSSEDGSRRRLEESSSDDQDDSDSTDDSSSDDQTDHEETAETESSSDDGSRRSLEDSSSDDQN